MAFFTNDERITPGSERIHSVRTILSATKKSKHFASVF